MPVEGPLVFRPFVVEQINSTQGWHLQAAHTIGQGCLQPLILRECPNLSNLKLMFKLSCQEPAQRLGLRTCWPLMVLSSSGSPPMFATYPRLEERNPLGAYIPTHLAQRDSHSKNMRILLLGATHHEYDVEGAHLAVFLPLMDLHTNL